ncbi:MAG: hypothetical protein RL701_2787, partial [Pseudomonadota bacterium]
MAIGPLYRPIVEVVREAGVDVEAVIASQGLNCEQLFAAETRLAPDQGRALGRALFRALPAGVDRSELGLKAAERFAARDADLLGYILDQSAHPLAAVHALTDYARLVGDSADFRVHTANEQVSVVFALTGGKQMLPEAADFAVAAIFRLLRDRTGGVVKPVAVHLPRPKPRTLRLFQRFFGLDVQFDAPAGTLIYERACMLLPFPHSDRRLGQLLEQHAVERVRGLPPDGWQDRVRAIIAEGLSHGDCALDSVAARCGVGERTLRRRLSETGTSYRALVDDVRRERALTLLELTDSISNVAQQLGFSDATAFA